METNLENIYRQNEYATNEKVSKATRYLFYFELVMFILCWTKVFDISANIINIAFITSLLPLLLPTIIVDVLHIGKFWVKYLIALCLISVTGICYVVFTFQTMMVFVIPTLLMALYLDKQVIIYTCIWSVINIILSHLITCFVILQPWIEPFKDPKMIMWYGALPRVLYYLICAGIIIMLNSRYAKYIRGFYRLSLDNEVMNTEKIKLEDNKSSSELSAILNTMTQREQEVFELLIKGYTNAQIANQLHLSMGTVKNYVSVIYDKTEIRDRTSLAIRFNHIS